LETATIAKDTTYTLPVGVSLVVSLPALREDFIATTTRATSIVLKQDAIIDKVTSKLVDAVDANITASTVLQTQAGALKTVGPGTFIQLGVGTKLAVPASAPAARPQQTVVGRPVEDFQKLVGADPDNNYGKETHSKGYTWAKKNTSTSIALQFKQKGPVVLASKLFSLGKAEFNPVSLGAIQSAYATWKARNVSSPPPAAAVPLTVEDAQQTLQQMSFTSRLRSFIDVAEEYWWVFAVTAVAVGGLVIAKKRREAKALPATSGW